MHTDSLRAESKFQFGTEECVLVTRKVCMNTESQLHNELFGHHEYNGNYCRRGFDIEL